MITADRPQWRTSSRSSNGEKCVEVAPWRTSTYSSNGEACVESSPAMDRVLIRHSKHPDAGTIEFTFSAWAAFVREAIDDQPSANGVVTVARVSTDTLVRSLRTDVELRFDEGEWSAFVAGARDGEFDFSAPLSPAAQ